MAVQAQYPSNALFLNRNTQEVIGIDCSLQPQNRGGGLLDHHQSNMFFSNGGTGAVDNRKRGREASATTVAAAATTNNTGSSGNMISNPFTLQPHSQPLQLIDLSQLHRHPRPDQSAPVSTGLRLASINQHQQSRVPESMISASSSILSSDDFAACVKQHGDEIDWYLVAQGEQLRRALAEKRQRHYRALLGAAEEAVLRRLREKEAEVEKATRRNAELEARAAHLTMESHVWQARARAQEAAAASLQAQLQQAIITGGNGQASPEDGGCCGSDAEDAESAYVDPDRVVAVEEPGPTCRACRRRTAAVVLLPCRHLCLCSECDRAAEACPVCFTARASSVEVYLPQGPGPNEGPSYYYRRIN